MPSKPTQAVLSPPVALATETCIIQSSAGDLNTYYTIHQWTQTEILTRRKETRTRKNTLDGCSATYVQNTVHAKDGDGGDGGDGGGGGDERCFP